MTAGPLLRRWRRVRRFSQLALAGEAGVSQRHLSFVESGRARPSRELLLHLAGVLEMPLRDRNALLMAAGFAPAYHERPLDHPDMEPARRAVRLLLDRHEPYPAVVVDRRWNLVDANQGAGRLTQLIVDPASPAVTRPLNLMRLTLHPAGLRSAIVNWDEVAGALLDRLRRDALAYPDDEGLQELANELESAVGEVNLPAPETSTGVLLPIHYRLEETDIRLFSTLVTIGSPLDVTLQELSIELFFPADESSDRALRDLVET